MSTPIIDAITAGRPILGGILKAGKAVIQNRLQERTNLPPPVAATIAASDNAGALTEIAENSNVVLTTIKPMRRSVEGWLAIGGAAVTLLNQLGPSLGITVDPVVSDAVETITAAVGFPAGTGKIVVASGTVLLFGALWVRRKWYTHSVTPAAADRAVAQGKAV